MSKALSFFAGLILLIIGLLMMNYGKATFKQGDRLMSEGKEYLRWSDYETRRVN